VTLATSSGSVEDLNVSTLQGWMPCTRHTRVTVPFPTSTCDTRSCESQCDVTLARLDGGDGYAGRATRRLEKACALARAGDVNTDHDPAAAMHYANQLAVVGRLDNAAVQVAHGTEHARRKGNAMALDMWALVVGRVHLAAGRLSAARSAVESQPPP
jgi:hypothetical protein